MNINDQGLIETAREYAEYADSVNRELKLTRPEGGSVKMLEALFRDRKVLLALFGVVQTIVAHYFELPTEVWAAIDTLVLALIAAIAYEDAAEKRAGR